MEVIKIPSTIYQRPPQLGCFGIVSNNSIEWETCRDRFHTKSDPADFVAFLLYHSKGNDVNIIEFMRTVEQAIRLPMEHQLLFRKTTDSTLLHVTMSPWWKYRLRRSLLTALLRCGADYTHHSGEGFVKALKSQPYTSNTWYAVERFMSGYTSCKIRKNLHVSGWQNFFHGNNKSIAETVLVKKRKHKEVEPTKGEQDVP